MGRLRTKLTYANVVATLAIVLVLSGGTAVAVTGGNFLLGKANSASSKTSLSAAVANKALQITNSSTGAGATALGLTTANGHPPLAVSSDAKIGNLNADELDGRDAGAFGAVREFYRNIAAASAGFRSLLSFHGLSISSDARIVSGPLLECDLEATATGAGEFDNSWIFGTGSDAFALSSGTATPADRFFLARARGNGSRSVGQLVFHNAVTGHTLTVAYSVYGIPSGDVNNQGCTWQGTVTAAA